MGCAYPFAQAKSRGQTATRMQAESGGSTTLFLFVLHASVLVVGRFFVMPYSFKASAPLMTSKSSAVIWPCRARL